MSWRGKVKDISSFLKTLSPEKEIKILIDKSPSGEGTAEEGKGKGKSGGWEESFAKMIMSHLMSPIFTGGEGKVTPIEDIADDSGNDRYFLKKLSSILRDNLYQRQEPGKRSGDLDHKKLYKVRLSDRLFTKRGGVEGKEYNLVLAIDCSGSMMGEKMNYAKHFLRKLFKVLHKDCNIAIVAFNSLIETLKTFDEKIDSPELDNRIKETISGKMLNGEYTGLNHDHLAVDKARELLQRVKGKKIVLMLSDGIPACGCDDPKGKLHEAVEITEHQGVSIIGISILYEPKEEFYKYGAIVSKVEQLYDVVLTELSKIIKRAKQ